MDTGVDPWTPKERLHRFMQLPGLIDLLERKALYIGCIEDWPDPYEGVGYREVLSWLPKELSCYRRSVFGMSWSRRGDTDALWRIYCRDGIGVRISVGGEALLHAADKYSDTVLGPVSYYRDRVDFGEKRDKLSNEGGTDGALMRLCLLKREAFDHEREVRLLLYCQGSLDIKKDEVGREWMYLPVEPRDLIQEVCIAPHCPPWAAEAIRLYCRRSGFGEQQVTQSLLYRADPSGIPLDA